MTLPTPPSARERERYYIGLPSRAPLVAQSSTFIWEEPEDPEVGKTLGGFGPHPIKDLMEKHPQEIFDALESKSVQWTSIDMVRIGYQGEYPGQYERPIILWVGVKPSTLSGEDGVQAAVACKNVLVKHGITDVECEIRESEVHGPWGNNEEEELEKKQKKKGGKKGRKHRK